MALFGTRVREAMIVTAAAVDQATDNEPSAAASGVMTLEDLVLNTGWILRDEAYAVPAYRRARTLVAQSIAQASLKRRTSDGRIIPGSPFLKRPDPRRTSVAFWADIVGDLCDYGVAYAVNVNGDWLFESARGSGKRKHARVERVDPELVDVRRGTDADPDSYLVTLPDGRTVEYPADYVIAFESAAGGWLQAGARAIRTARLLEDSARRYAETPSPTTLLSNSGPRKTPDQVRELLDAWETARRNRSTAYAGRDITVESVGFDAQAIALSDSRAAAIRDIARLTGVPSLYLGIGLQDASLTYQTATAAKLDLLEAFTPYATAIEQRLSFDDVTGEGTEARFDFGAWLRTDPMYRADLYARLVPLGILTVDEARAFEDFAPTNTPAPEPAPTSEETP